MATIRGARKRRRVKMSSSNLPLALASHQLGPCGEEDNEAVMATLPALTFIEPPNKTAEVFAVTELLENVLLQLTRKDALMCQRVNRTWKDTVVGSIKLQRFLFLAAEKDLGVVAIMAPTPMPTELRVMTYIQRDDQKAQDSETHGQLIVPNPLIFFNADLHNRGAALQASNISYADLLAHSRLPFHNIDLLVGLFSGSLSHSACLDMFLTQPPVCEVSVELNIVNCDHCQGKETCCFALANVKNPKGLRVKDIFAAARSFHFRQPTHKEDREQEDVTSISVGFQAVAEGTKDGVLLVTAEDMRSAKAEALEVKVGTVDVVQVDVVEDDQ